VTDARASGRIYNVGEPFSLSVAERVEHIARAANWSGRIVILPTDQTPAHLRTDGNVAQNIIVDSSRIRNELDYQESIAVEEAFKRTIAWESAHLPEQFEAKDFDYATEDAVLAHL
jgi:nucleoside-diphosphate-sugar epimerase